MDLQQVRAFQAVVREGSFSKAAHRLFRTQPTVTMAVQALERDLGVKLFDRLGRRTRLTPAGQTFLESVGPLLEQWEGLGSYVREAVSETVSGPVRIGAGESALLYLLPGPIRRFQKRYPEVSITARNQPAEETLAMLKSGELDFGFRALSNVPDNLFYRPSRTFDRMVIAPKGHPVFGQGRITLKVLGQYPLIMPWKGSTTRQLVERAFEEARISYQIGLEAGGIEIIKRYAALGLGIGIVLEFCLSPEDKKTIAARSVRPLFGQDSYGVVVKKGRHLTRAARALIQEIDPQFPVRELEGGYR
ncbi:MAG: LysR family transcriptional regulator [Candidatus Omnitrophica bacterium]|nr:LysR family transcriptional regulator [Candidatus Omnitrophota bacterium]